LVITSHFLMLSFHLLRQIGEVQILCKMVRKRCLDKESARAGMETICELVYTKSLILGSGVRPGWEPLIIPSDLIHAVSDYRTVQALVCHPVERVPSGD